MAHGLQPDSRMRLYLLDLGDERSLVIIIEGHGEAAWQARCVEATAIVESMEFRAELPLWAPRTTPAGFAPPRSLRVEVQA